MALMDLQYLENPFYDSRKCRPGGKSKSTL
jgi:hypothetical protein